ncbi:g4849 [Coccomyxa viridis]|uniref:G4849 protein n=1 Tax=Coccomyxa viridis TaxID=1274662 RepID=A0ABP1FY53_9CHLO
MLPGPDKWHELPDANFEVVLEHEVLTTVPVATEIKGVLFSLHGCLQLTKEWGFPSETCPECSGMPEEMVSVYRAVKRGYAVVAIGTHLSQAAFNFHCFNTTWPPEDHIEGPELVNAMREVLTKQDWWHLPRFVYGSSRGGAMALIMAQRFPFQAVGSMVMGLRPEKMMETDLTPRNLQTGATWKFPPVLLMAAGNDQPEILELINNTQAALQTKGVHVQQMMMEPYQISPEFFNQRMKEVSLEKSVAVFEDLKGVGILKEDNCSHFIQYDDWRTAEGQLKRILLKHFPEDLGAVNGSRGFERAFREMLWASEAIHELTAEHTDVMLDFFEKNAALDETPMHLRHPFVAVEARVVGDKADLDMPIPKYHHHSHAHALGEWFQGLRASGGPGGR